MVTQERVFVNRLIEKMFVPMVAGEIEVRREQTYAKQEK